MNKTKVFGIGFHKTGTSSLGKALEILGYRVCGCFGSSDPNLRDNVYESAFKLANEYDAFQDNPWPLLYKELDKKYPHSKFILTIRSTDQWIESIVRHKGTRDNQMRKWIYGVGHPKGNEEIYIKRYEKHNSQVLDYFKSRPKDLLVVKTEELKWNKVCSFLEKDIPDLPFPYLSPKYKLAKKIKNYTKKLLQAY